MMNCIDFDEIPAVTVPERTDPVVFPTDEELKDCNCTKTG